MAESCSDLIKEVTRLGKRFDDRGAGSEGGDREGSAPAHTNRTIAEVVANLRRENHKEQATDVNSQIAFGHSIGFLQG